MQQQTQNPKFFSVDGNEPVTLEELISANNEEGVTPLESDFLAAIEALEVGEKISGGNCADIERVS